MTPEGPLRLNSGYIYPAVEKKVNNRDFSFKLTFFKFDKEYSKYLIMEDHTRANRKIKETFIVYKFEINLVNPEIYRVYAWKNLNSKSSHRLIPKNYKLCDESKIIGRDYFLVVHLKSWEDNICYYYVNIG